MQWADGLDRARPDACRCSSSWPASSCCSWSCWPGSRTARAGATRPATPLLGALLVTAELVLVCAVGCVIGGRLVGLSWPALVWILAPVVLTRYFIAGGSPLTDFGTVFRRRCCRTRSASRRPRRSRPGCLLLASAWLSLAPAARSLLGDSARERRRVRRPAPRRCSTRSCGPRCSHRRSRCSFARRGRAALARPRRAAAGARRRSRSSATCPESIPAGTGSGRNLDQFREYSWSRRVLEYLPLAGFVGLAIRHRPAAAFFGWLLLTAIRLPVRPRADARPADAAFVPGYATYALLTASIVLLVPSRRPATAASPEPTT